jgi:hypothetical protein
MSVDTIKEIHPYLVRILEAQARSEQELGKLWDTPGWDWLPDRPFTGIYTIIADLVGVPPDDSCAPDFAGNCCRDWMHDRWGEVTEGHLSAEDFLEELILDGALGVDHTPD